MPGKVDLDTAAALHLFTRQPWGIGVEHGLRPVTEKKTVTKAAARVIQEIDGKPAFQMFEDYIKAAGLHVPADKRVEFVIRNELGVFFFDDICKVRAIHQIRPDGALVSTGEIPEGLVDLHRHRRPEALVAAARRAAEEARKSLKGAKAAGVLVFSCFCRTLILGTEFKREVEVIRDVFPETPISASSPTARSRASAAGSTVITTPPSSSPPSPPDQDSCSSRSSSRSSGGRCRRR